MDLFHIDQYLTEFEAKIDECAGENGFWAVALSRSAFYYTSGGQPCDTGTINGVPVFGVERKGGRVWHYVKCEMPEGETVKCRVDWTRRFDHMCQHAGEHLTAWALWERFGLKTIGLHVGGDISTFDVERPDAEFSLSRDDLDGIEHMVFERIQSNDGIKCWFPCENELAAIKMRKPPGDFENIRIVQMGNYEAVACGGTHPKSTGEIGVVKIISCSANRGNFRFSFVAGKRALTFLQTAHNQAATASVLLGTGIANLAAYTQKSVDKAAEAQLRADEAGERYALSLKEGIMRAVRVCAEADVAFAVLPPLPQSAVLSLSSGIVEFDRTACVLLAPNESGFFLSFAKADGMPNMGNALRECAAGFGGKGGGRPELAMGSLPPGTDTDAFRSAVYAYFNS